MEYKAHFITSVLFNREIKTVKIDKTAIDFYIKLTELNAQFRKIDVNYNQIVKILYRHNILHAHQPSAKFFKP